MRPSRPAVVVGDAQRGGVLVAHEVPCRGEAGLGVDALGLAIGDILDLRGQRGDEAGLLEAEVLEDEGRLAVDGARTTRLVLAATEDVLEVGVADGCADAVGVGVLVADHVDLADRFCHGCAPCCESFGLVRCVPCLRHADRQARGLYKEHSYTLQPAFFLPLGCCVGNWMYVRRCRSRFSVGGESLAPGQGIGYEDGCAPCGMACDGCMSWTRALEPHNLIQ